MTPREELASRIFETKSGDITKTLKPFAIGKWVPVSVRLPPECFTGNAIHSVHGKGYVVLMERDSRFGTFYRPDMITSFHTATDITHWLELDMPEVES